MAHLLQHDFLARHQGEVHGRHGSSEVPLREVLDQRPPLEQTPLAQASRCRPTRRMPPRTIEWHVRFRERFLTADLPTERNRLPIERSERAPRTTWQALRLLLPLEEAATRDTTAVRFRLLPQRQALGRMQFLSNREAKCSRQYSTRHESSRKDATRPRLT